MKHDFVKNFPRTRIVCIGDIMLDIFIQGNVDRISPEAPVPVLQYQQEKQMLGGAGNVVANLCALGCQAFFIGRVGQDTDSQVLEKALANCHAEAVLIKSEHVPTATKTRFISSHQHLMRFDKEVIAPCSVDEQTQIMDALIQRLPQTDLVILSDYAKGIFSADFTPRIIQLCRQHHVAVFVDPKGIDYTKYSHASLIKPNRKELELVSGRRLSPQSETFLQDVEACTRKLLNQLQIENCVVTLSDKGMLYVPKDEQKKVLYLSTAAHEVFDVSGAGDTSLATLGLSYAAGADFKEAISAANIAAGIVVGKVGTATVSCAELVEGLARQPD